MVVSAQGGHDHLVSVGIVIGPLILRVTVLAAMSVVAGNVLLRPFLADGHRTSVCGVGAAAVAVSFELLLSGGLVLPEQLVPLLLAGVALPLYLLLSTDPRFTRLVDRGRAVAPWVFVGMTAVSAVVLCRAWFVALSPKAMTATLHTGVVLTLVTLAWWFMLAPRRVVTRVLGAVVASALVPATAQAVML